MDSRIRDVDFDKLRSVQNRKHLRRCENTEIFFTLKIIRSVSRVKIMSFIAYHYYFNAVDYTCSKVSTTTILPYPFLLRCSLNLLHQPSSSCEFQSLLASIYPKPRLKALCISFDELQRLKLIYLLQLKRHTWGYIQSRILCLFHLELWLDLAAQLSQYPVSPI